jgi:hypothetical protein
MPTTATIQMINFSLAGPCAVELEAFIAETVAHPSCPAAPGAILCTSNRVTRMVDSSDSPDNIFTFSFSDCPCIDTDSPVAIGVRVVSASCPIGFQYEGQNTSCLTFFRDPVEGAPDWTGQFGIRLSLYVSGDYCNCPVPSIPSTWGGIKRVLED